MRPHKLGTAHVDARQACILLIHLFNRRNRLQLSHHRIEAKPEYKGLDNRNEVLQAYVEDKAGAERFLWNYDLVKLVHADGKVTGAIFETEDGNVQVNAANVILATGGYPGNSEMMQALSPMAVASCTACSYSPKDRGQGIKAGLWAGASMDLEAAPMVFNRGLVAPGVACGYDENGMFRGTVGQFNAGSQPFMKVAKDGRRFMNEACPYDFTCFAAQQHADGVWAMIFDANMAEDVKRFATDGCSKMTQTTLAKTPDPAKAYAQQIEDGLLFKCDTLDELADKLGFEGDAKATFLAEIDRYNGFFDAQDDEDFGKEAYSANDFPYNPFPKGAMHGPFAGRRRARTQARIICPKDLDDHATGPDGARLSLIG